ncbi:AarF/ABC1/UbiB kinase family protein [Limibacter armeniacum]|uniref:ABC1 kinase family protein n=1 Tax=Limibacter armeniacum TaxID=466084 RepID=UPI002FE52B7E
MSEKNKAQNSIPASKVQRASRFMQTGVKVGANYVKHYAKKLVDPNTDREELHQDNARDIYDALSELKGSALKVAQMMSMDKNMLPTAYSDKFRMAQYSAPPLSYPLVVKTFRKHFDKSPTDIFDSFTTEAVNAASIGQVHKAEKDGKTLAVKVQYPGVAESVSADLKMVKPFAVKIAGLNEKEVDLYMEEVESMLLDETRYDLELKRSISLTQACAHIPNIRFPKYYPEYSSTKILTMDWLEGTHLDKFLQTNPSQEIRNKVGQALWDFYDFQIHELREVHADPHPGNFIMGADGVLGIIDFGCVKVLPEDFYQQYFVLMDPTLREDRQKMLETFYTLRFIHPDDSDEDKQLLEDTFKQMIQLLGRPFHKDSFDFGQDEYFEEIFAFGEKSSRIKPLKEAKKPRGVKHGLYLNRTYFGLYSILNQLKANICTKSAYFSEKA